MPCLAAPKIPAPPGLDLLLPALPTIPQIPTIGLNLCCDLPELEINVPGLPISLGTIPGIAVILQPVMAVVMAAIDLINTYLDQVQIDCPLE